MFSKFVWAHYTKHMFRLSAKLSHFSNLLEKKKKKKSKFPSLTVFFKNHPIFIHSPKKASKFRRPMYKNPAEKYAPGICSGGHLKARGLDSVYLYLPACVQLLVQDDRWHARRSFRRVHLPRRRRASRCSARCTITDLTLRHKGHLNPGACVLWITIRNTGLNRFEYEKKGNLLWFTWKK